VSHGCFVYTILKLDPNGKVIGHLEYEPMPGVVFAWEKLVDTGAVGNKSNAPPQLVKFSGIAEM
jgi:hypothetical protein